MKETEVYLVVIAVVIAEVFDLELPVPPTDLV
jgi:hypothetical protein